MKRVHVCVVVLLLALAPLGVAQALDANGNFLGPVNLPGMDDPLGTVLHKIAAPTSKIAGITCTGDSLWVISYPGAAQVLYEVDPISGATKSTIQLTTTSCYGLGFDTRRNEFVLSASGGTITRVDLKGVVTTQWPSPSGSPIGVAYDPMRDGYWVPDWSNTNMYLVDARNGSVLKSFNIGTQGLTRLAGCGYSPINDLLYTNGRGENKGGIIDPVSGQLLYTVAHPGGTNVGQGAVFFHRWQAPFSGDWNSGANQTIYSYEMGLPRVECNTTVKYGTTLQIKWVSTRDAGRVYKGAAAFTESGFTLANRLFPLTLDDLFIVSLNVPALFNGFTGNLDTMGEALGAVVLPNIPQLNGVPFSLAFATVDASAPFGISAISGPQKVLITN